MRRTVPPSAEIQASIDKLLSGGGVGDPQRMLSELARLGARLIIQRAVEEEFDSWLGRARYERRPERQRGLRNGYMTTVGIVELRQNLSAYLRRVERGERLVVTDRNRPVAELGPRPRRETRSTG